MAQSKNKTIAKNTISLYFRTIIVLIVSLYTSRVILQGLGVIDLGIYNVVGGLVALLSIFQASQAKATSRFVAYALGELQSEYNVSKVFSSCLTIHILIAVIILLVGELLGPVLVSYLLDIPDDRIMASQLVFQFALITFCLSIIRVPFDSVIIAHENMSIYAYMSILEAFLLLGVALLVKYTSCDSLILYSGLVCVVGFLLLSLYGLYVLKKYQECSLKLCWDKHYNKQILSFSGWTLLGTSSNTFTQQGVSILLNNFVGLVANTALGFANQINTALGRFVSSFTTAFNPQIIKNYADGDLSGMELLMNRASKFSFYLAYIMALPLMFNMDFVLHVWLGEVPEYTAIFSILIVVCAVIDSTTCVYNMAILAIGKIRNYEIAISISFLLDLFTAFLILLLRFNPAYVFASRIITRGLFNMIIGLYFLKKQMHFSVKAHLFNVIIPILFLVALSIPGAVYITSHFFGWTSLLLSVIYSVIFVSVSFTYLLLSKSERDRLKLYVKNRIHK